MTLEPNEPQVPQNPTPPVPEVPKQDPIDIQSILAGLDEAAVRKIPAVVKLLEAVRSEEKDKLYKTIQDKDNKNKSLTDEITDLKEQIKSKEEQLMEGDKELVAQLAAMQESINKLNSELEKKDEESRIAKLESYKKDKIASANGKLVTALVRGTTEEEIDASFELAKSEYERIAGEFEAKKTSEEEARKAQEEADRIKAEEAEKEKRKAGVPKVTNPSTSQTMTYSADDVKKMSSEEYAKYRAEILRSLKN